MKRTIQKLCILFGTLLFLAGSVTAQKKPADPSARRITLESRYLHFPVKNGAPKKRLSLSVNGVKVREIEIELGPLRGIRLR